MRLAPWLFSHTHGLSKYRNHQISIIRSTVPPQGYILTPDKRHVVHEQNSLLDTCLTTTSTKTDLSSLSFLSSLDTTTDPGATLVSPGASRPSLKNICWVDRRSKAGGIPGFVSVGLSKEPLAPLGIRASKWWGEFAMVLKLPVSEHGGHELELLIKCVSLATLIAGGNVDN